MRLSAHNTCLRENENEKNAICHVSKAAGKQLFAVAHKKEETKLDAGARSCHGNVYWKTNQYLTLLLWQPHQWRSRNCALQSLSMTACADIAAVTIKSRQIANAIAIAIVVVGTAAYASA